jgi:hypothetical protein
MSTWEYPQFVPILIFIQADGTDIILISCQRKKGNLSFTELLILN